MTQEADKIEAARREMRERCAQCVEALFRQSDTIPSNIVAAAIRALKLDDND